MSTRAVVYLHHKEEKENGLNYTMKLYHHRDGYPEYLGQKLNEIFSEFKKEYESNNSGSLCKLLTLIWDEEWFQPTCWYHADAEYVYHVYYEDVWNLANASEKKFKYEIAIQMGDDHEGCWDEKMDIFYTG